MPGSVQGKVAVTKTELYATAYGAVEGAMRAVGFPVSMSTGRDIEHIAHRVADAIYTIMQIEACEKTQGAQLKLKGEGD